MVGDHLEVRANCAFHIIIKMLNPENDEETPVRDEGREGRL